MMISKYILITTAVKVMRVSKSPAKINQAFERLLLRLSSVFFALEFLQSKIMNMGMPGCLYSLKLGGVFQSGEYGRITPLISA
jgi:hypothetical protein